MRLFSTGTMNSRPSQSWHSFMKPSCASGVWLSKPKLAGADEGAGEELSIHCHSSSQYCSTGFKIYLDRRNVISLKTIFAVSSYAHGISDSIAIIWLPCCKLSVSVCVIACIIFGIFDVEFTLRNIYWFPRRLSKFIKSHYNPFWYASLRLFPEPTSPRRLSLPLRCLSPLRYFCSLRLFNPLRYLPHSNKALSFRVTLCFCLFSRVGISRSPKFHILCFQSNQY